LLGFQVKLQKHEETDSKDAVSMVFQEKKRKKAAAIILIFIDLHV
jgi:hypothetical protein